MRNGGLIVKVKIRDPELGTNLRGIVTIKLVPPSGVTLVG